MIKHFPNLIGSEAKHGETVLRVVAIAAAASVLASCAAAPSKPQKRSKEYFSESEYGVKASPRVVEYGQPVPQGGGRYMVGKPYTVKGKVYKPKLDEDYTAVGLASWYGSAFHGRRTANGEVYDMDGLSAAHPTMPLPSYARITNLKNGRSVMVRVNDRGPYHSNRVIDVSARTAELLDMKGHGTAKVEVDYVGPAKMEGHDQKMLLASYSGPGSSASGDTMFAMRAPSRTIAPSRTVAPVMVAMASAAPIPRERPDVYAVDGMAIDPYTYAQIAAREAGDAPVAVAAANVEAPSVTAFQGGDEGLAEGPQVLGTYTVRASYNGGAMPASASGDDYYVPTLVAASERSSYAADDAVTPAHEAAAELAHSGNLQTALNAAAEREASRTGGSEIQVGVFAKAENAERIGGTLARFGTITRASITVDGRTMETVRIVLADAGSADEALEAAHDAGALGARLLRR